MVNGNDLNLSILLDVFDGDVFLALEKARKYNRMTITMSAKSLERLLIKLFINVGWNDAMVAAALTKGQHAVPKGRVKRIRKEMINGKDKTRKSS